MTQRCKIWLGLIFSVYSLLFVVNLANNWLHHTLTMYTWVSLTVQGGLIVGIGLLLFAHKRTGFFLICLIQGAAYIANVFFFGNSVLSCMLAFVPMPLITWYFLKTDNTWPALG